MSEILTLPENYDVNAQRKIKSPLEDEIPSKKSRKALYNEQITIRLEKAVLGNREHIIQNLTSSVKRKHDEDEEIIPEREREPAWIDEDDENMVVDDALESCRHKPLVLDGSQNYQEVLRTRFTSTFGTPLWARLSSKDNKNSKNDDSDDDEPLLQRCGSMIGKGDGTLPKGILDIKRVSSLNCESMKEGPIVTSVEFHQKSTVALVAGISGIASIFQVDGKGNSKLASVKFDHFPVRCARFNAEGTEMLVGSNLHSHFYCYDLMEGKTLRIPLHQQINMKKFEVSRDGKFIAICSKFGDIHLLSARSKEMIGALHMNCQVSAIAFSSDSSLLYSHGDGGEIYVWDMNKRMCLGRVQDEGCLSGTCLAVSDQFLATGCSSGIVNLYDRTKLLQPRPRLIKSIMNLVTPASALAFDSTAQILAIASDQKNESVRMVHLSSLTVFNNFPSLNSQLSKIQALAFSPHSGYFSVTNNKSTAFLYRLRHFGNY